jgi:hypothetical protein
VSASLKLLSEQRTQLQTAVALREVSAEVGAGGAEPPGGDALAAEAEALALDLLRSARVALGTGGRISDTRARHAELASAVKLAHAAAAVTQALDRRQGRGTTQRVIVEKVEVNGGQAIVGAVAPGGGRAGQGGAR